MCKLLGLVKIIVIILFFPALGFATSQTVLTPQLILNSIQAIQPGERDGDELYFDISVLANGGSHDVRAPNMPLHWSSNVLSEIKNISLWSEPLTNGQSKTLMLSLMDQDAFPWNPDDLIGSIRVTILNSQDQLKVQWQDQPLVTVTEGAVYSFDIKGKEGHYKVMFMLRTK